MEENILKICVNGKINHVFAKAQSALLKKYSVQIHDIVDHSDKVNYLEKLWNTEYNGTVKKINSDIHVVGCETWQCVVFPSYRELIVFLLQWG